MATRKKKAQPIIMPDMSEGGVGTMAPTSGGSLNPGTDRIGVVLNLEVRTRKTSALEEVTLPEGFERDRDRFEDGWARGKAAGLELKQNRDVAGKLTLTHVAADATETIVGYLPGKLVRQTLVCDEPGKARMVYRFELELAPEELVLIGKVLLHAELRVEFKPAAPSLPLTGARDLEGEA